MEGREGHGLQVLSGMGAPSGPHPEHTANCPTVSQLTVPTGDEGAPALPHSWSYQIRTEVDTEPSALHDSGASTVTDIFLG